MPQQTFACSGSPVGVVCICAALFLTPSGSSDGATTRKGTRGPPSLRHQGTPTISRSTWRTHSRRQGYGAERTAMKLAEELNKFREHVWEWLTQRLTAGTQIRYEAARRLLDEWCRARGLNLEETPNQHLDVVIARRILGDFEDDEAGQHRRHRYVDMVATMQCRYSVHMRLSQRIVSEWQKIAPPAQAEPLPWEAAFALAVAAVWHAQNPAAASHVVLCFCGLPRFGESLVLLANDVYVSPAHVRPQVAVLLCSHKQARV